MAEPGVGQRGERMDRPKVMDVEKNLVMKSIETPGDGHCADFFRTPDNSFGFEEYRRDAEDGAGEGRGWHPIGYPAGGRYPTEEAATAAAGAAVPWLENVIEPHNPPDTA